MVVVVGEKLCTEELSHSEGMREKVKTKRVMVERKTEMNKGEGQAEGRRKEEFGKWGRQEDKVRGVK